MSFDVALPQAAEHILGSCHTVPFPPEVVFAFISVHSSRGEVCVSYSNGGTVTVQKFRPLSPLYDLNNPGCGGNVVVIVPEVRQQAAIATVTFSNDSKEEGRIAVLAGAAFAVPANQAKVIVHRKLPSKSGTTVNIVFTCPN